ncbi:MAG: 3-deoxy-7-phosphoheptulonate synthase [Bacteroidales bacterium]|nr:3-deoxy-7-phosphoheptulonate synthase [Bacteroidales bacterium]
MDDNNYQETIKESKINWGIENDRPIIISGPCSAESRDQVVSTALKLSEMGIKIFRAGVWKPRSRPGNYTGSGSIGLEWLKEVKKLTGMLTAVEVATKDHVQEALQNDVDILWIGARTTVNPFVIQELAETMKGIKNPVLIKNPINPDLDLWTGAIERFLKAGVCNLGVIHRGFSLYKNKKYRNEPLWQIPLDLKTRFPDLPMICDPSHICGNTENIYEVSQKALDLNFDGLMIESHINPLVALSDAKQQITPSELKDLIEKLNVREKVNHIQYSLEKLRGLIDEKDAELVKIMGERMNIVKEIGKIKRENNTIILQADRWNSILGNMIYLGEKYDLNKDFIELIFKSIHQESIYQQSLLMNE